MIKSLATEDYFLYTQVMQKDHEYCANLQANILSITGVYTLMYTCKLCVKCHSCEFLIIIMNFGVWKITAKAKCSHSGKKFAPRKINLLYG